MGFSTNQKGFWKGQPASADPAKRLAVTKTLAAKATAILKSFFYAGPLVPPAATAALASPLP